MALVIDVLRATSSIVTALAEGYAWVQGCRTVEEARLLADHHGPQALLAGERGGLPPQGFHKGNSPREFLHPHPRGLGLILTTSNGTRALAAAQAADQVLVLSFLNLSATAEWLRHQDKPIVLVCSGTGEDFSLEDSLLASALLQILEPTNPSPPSSAPTTATLGTRPCVKAKTANTSSRLAWPTTSLGAVSSTFTPS
ncbi:MAG: 2-phosphosulfolactate phosphatase [Blastochloris sp.]|nr:2-phosphosulfolactate phosphatase [Blastochloris sp.]